MQPKVEKMVCKLKESLYELKQIAKYWNIKIDSFMKEYNLVTVNMTFVFITTKGLWKLFVGFLLMMGLYMQLRNQQLITLLSIWSQDYIKIEVIQGWIDYEFVGFQITTNFFNPIFINQSQYIINIINFFRMENVNPIVSPYYFHTLVNVQVGPTNN